MTTNSPASAQPDTRPSQASRTPGRVAGALLLAFGAFWVLVAFDLLRGNRDLATPGRPLVPGVTTLLQSTSWRLGLALALVLAVAALTAGWFLLRGIGGRRWALLAAAVAGALGALAPSSLVATLAIVVLGVLLPAALVLVGELTGRKPRLRPVGATAAVAGDAAPAAPLGETNGLAIAALIVVFFNGLVGAILGHVALGQLSRRNQRGRGLALAAIIIGWITVAIAVLGVAAVVVAAAVLSGGGS